MAFSTLLFIHANKSYMIYRQDKRHDWYGKKNGGECVCEGASVLRMQ